MPPADRHAPGAPLRAMLVEDEPVFQAQVASAFGELGPGWTLQMLDTGSDALEALAQPDARFDVLLVDLGLPDVGGIEVIRAARALHPSMPVMVASIHSDESHVLEAVRAGARGYLLKDDTALEISEAIARVVSGEYPISPSLARHLFKLAEGGPEAAPSRARLALAPKELELLKLLAKGHPYKKAALLMGVALSTVQTYVRQIYQKLEAHSKIEAIERARGLGLLE